MRLLLTLLLLSTKLFAQHDLSGIVLSSVDNSPLGYASVFINNSGKGTMAGVDGKFTIHGINENEFELVASYSGFISVDIKINAANLHQYQTIKLHPRTLNEIVIRRPDKDGWKNWGRMFTEYFIGTSDFASDCKIENPEVIRFFYDNKENILTAYSNDNIIVTNKALGYKVRYQLEDFSYDSRKRTVSFEGYTGFEDLIPRNKHNEVKWLKNRLESYRGSIMHFMRALYANNMESEGFDVREKITVHKTDSAWSQVCCDLMYKTARLDSTIFTIVPGPMDGFTKLPRYIDLIQKSPISESKFCMFDSSSGQAVFYIANGLQVLYKNAYARSEYVKQTQQKYNSKFPQMSSVHLVTDSSILIQSNGNYYDPLNLVLDGYWGWCKLAETLPSDYVLETK